MHNNNHYVVITWFLFTDEQTVVFFCEKELSENLKSLYCLKWHFYSVFANFKSLDPVRVFPAHEGRDLCISTPMLYHISYTVKLHGQFQLYILYQM